MKIIFISNGIKEVKTKIPKKRNIEELAERFRIDMLAKHGLLFKSVPHLIKIDYGI